ncbi:hypothetical protein FYZ42_02100 [Mobiluncus mulieris]|nr:hypothetical protein [Mobiluncus mulieris]
MGGWAGVVGGASLLAFPPAALPFTGVIPGTGTGLGGRLTGAVGFAVAPPSFGVAAGRNTGRAEPLVFMSVTKGVGWDLLPVRASVTMGTPIAPGFACSGAGFTGDAGFATCAGFGFPPGA